MSSVGVAADRNNFISAYAWLDDLKGTYTIAEVRKKEFQPYNGFLSRGFGDSTIWVRLTIDPAAVATQLLSNRELILRMRPLYLDEVELFDPLDTSGRRRVTGDRYSSESDDYQSLNFNYIIPKGDKPRDIYLRIKSTSSRFLQAEVYELRELQRVDRIQQLFYGLYLALVSLFFVWAAISWVTYRDPVISSFLVTQLFALAVGLSIFGYTRDFFGSIVSPVFIDNATSYSSVLIVFSAIFFYIRFWREYKPFKWFNRTLWLMLGVAALNFGLLVTGHTRQALSNNMGLIFFIPIITFLMVFTARGWQRKEPSERPLVPKSIITLYFGTNLLVLMAGALPGLGVLEGGAYSIYVGLMHGIINGAFAVGILQYRSYLLSQKRANLAIDLAIAQQEVIQERSFREERERLLAMLAHELRTPLATVRMLLGKDDIDSDTVGQIKRSVSEMNAVIERSVQVNQLEDSRITINRSPIDIVSEIKDIAETLEPGSSAVAISGPASLEIQSDRQLIRMVFSNLLDNAIKYREQGSTVDVRIACRPEKHIIDIVVENSPGPAGQPDSGKLFTKYYRSPMAHRQTGSGLGMYLVKGLLKALRGTIDYQPTNEKVRFHVCLPVSLSL